MENGKKQKKNKKKTKIIIKKNYNTFRILLNS